MNTWYHPYSSVCSLRDQGEYLLMMGKLQSFARFGGHFNLDAPLKLPLFRPSGSIKLISTLALPVGL